MVVKIVNRFRLSDKFEHVSDIISVNDKEFDVNLLPALQINEFSSHKGLRRLPKATKNAIIASLECTKYLTTEEKRDLGIFAGTSLSYIEHTLRFMSDAYNATPRLVSPMMFPNTVLNSISGWVSIILKSHAINTTINTGNNSGVDAMENAIEYLESGILRYALVIVTEEISPAVIESDLSSSHKYTEDTIAFLLEYTEDLQDGILIEDIYSKYTSINNFQLYIKEKWLDVDEYTIHKVDIDRNNMLSCNAINNLYEMIDNELNTKVILSFNNQNRMFSAIKIRRI